jgi:type I restriction enzyme R subunit
MDKLVNLSGLGTVREVANNFGGIAETWDEYLALQKKIYR